MQEDCAPWWFSKIPEDIPVLKTEIISPEKERLYFVQDAQVLCHRPHSQEDFGTILCPQEPDEEIKTLSPMSSRIGEILGGNLSIKWIWFNQWVLVDINPVAIKYHWNKNDKYHMLIILENYKEEK